MFGQRVAQLRQERGWSQNDLAARAGINQSYLSKIESGERPTPSILVVWKLAKAFNISVDSLVDSVFSPNSEGAAEATGAAA